MLSFILQDSVDTILNLTGIKNTVHVMPKLEFWVFPAGSTAVVMGDNKAQRSYRPVDHFIISFPPKATIVPWPLRRP